MLQGGFSEVLKSQNKREFASELISFTQRLGFQTVSATLVLDHMLGEAEFITVDNNPRAYKECSTASGRVCRSFGIKRLTLSPASEKSGKSNPDSE
jgi:hypothetical protein